MSNVEQREEEQMPAEENKAVVLRYIEEVWNRHDMDAIDGLVSPGYVNHAATTDGYRHGGARLIWKYGRRLISPGNLRPSRCPRMTPQYWQPTEFNY